MNSLTEAVPDIYSALDWLRRDSRKPRGEFRFKTHGHVPSVSRWVQAVSRLSNAAAAENFAQDIEADVKDEILVSAIGRAGWYRIRLLRSGEVSVRAIDRRPT